MRKARSFIAGIFFFFLITAFLFAPFLLLFYFAFVKGFFD